ncbi:glucose-6-phosphate isomerase [Micromonospora endophytica]|uniref:Glucose-6-phosphate isomerase n=1 Tax=Micromonospora endophytica TaxID=515350 RepID=A0A2W2CMW7_9ACTN|nr:glucose-6-phosphate isomerase [Micromonospora endophytica]PZF99340.1 glucose-6-phosphate isomerase [Micromonospora endophytica]RIW43015.1 glucose-6-phosphate isomerase [Micromonospora endophytica]BCJ61324.1 glucose-6-phosphate isomerase [Micromonospora endophytica]
MGELLDAPAEAAGGLAVYGAAAVDAAAPAATRQALVDADVPGWLHAHRHGRELLPQLAELTAELADLDHVVLVGPAEPALAAGTVARTTGRPLTVLDTTDPGPVRAALADRLARTVVVLAGRADTPEIDSHRRAYWQAFLDAGMTEAEASRHFVVVTEPGSSLEAVAAELGAIIVPAGPAVAEGYRALTAYTLVPCALAGVAVADLLDEAEAFSASLGRPGDNPGLALGAALAAAATTGRDKVALVADGSGVEGLGDWVAHLLAGTSRDGIGILPVVVESPDTPGVTGADVLTVSYGGALAAGAVPGAGTTADVAVNGPLGAHFLAWQYAAAMAATVRGTEPLDFPDTDFGGPRTAPPAEPRTPSAVEDAIEVYAPPGAPADLAGALRQLLDGVDANGYLAVVAYLDRHADADAARLRPLLAQATGRPVTFGWGPSHPRAVGQYHIGGPPAGSFLHVTGTVNVDLPVPGRPYSFGELLAAQAASDRRALAGRDRPLLHLHLTDRTMGLAHLFDAIGSLRA